MVALVQNDSLDWSSIVHLLEEIGSDIIDRICVAQDEILDQVKFVILIIDANVNLGLSETIFTGWIDELLDFELRQ